MLVRDNLKKRDSELHSRLEYVESKAKPLLEYVHGGTNLMFTTHGHSHILRVEKNYDWLLSSTDINSFESVELFLLLCCTFFHDAMMIPRSTASKVEARANHAAAARRFLTSNADGIGLDVAEADAISEIILGHSVQDFNRIQNDMAVGATLIQIRKLSACLCMADICHADISRAPRIVFKHLEMDERSAYHWKRHMQISGITRNTNKIRMDALYYSDDGLSAVQQYKDEIEKQLSIVKPYFDTILSPINNVELVTRKLNSEMDVELQFHANTPAILNILIEGVYNREDVFIRELVQNSLDACHLRTAQSMRRSEKYVPQIVITLLSEYGKLKGVRIDDNGIGIDISDIQETLLWIGNTISTREDINDLLNETTQKKLIATFGIGLLSCFKSADNIIIRSAKENKEPVELTLRNINDKIKPLKSNDTSIGSTFIIIVNRNLAVISEMISSLNYYFRMVRQVPLSLLKLEWDDKTAAYTRENIFLISSSEAEIIKHECLDDIESDFISHKIAGDDYSAWLSVPKDNDFKEGRVLILNEGIFVSLDNTSEWLPEYLIFCNGIINFSSRSIDLPVSRDRVVNNEKCKRKKEDIAIRALSFVDEIIKLSGLCNKDADKAVMVLLYLYTVASAENKQRLLKHFDKYNVISYKNKRNTTLHQIIEQLVQSKKDTIYIEYKSGQWVTELAKLDDKQLYHKPDDEVTLQAALLHQTTNIVISAKEAKQIAEYRIKEVDLLMDYFKIKNIKAIDLNVDNEIEGTVRSKNIPAKVRNRIGYSVKFVEIDGLPNKMGWQVGAETWINVSNPKMGRIYQKLLEDETKPLKIIMVDCLIDILAFRLEEGVDKIIEMIFFENISHRGGKK
ncbi:MAG: ATP-binding protein [Nitrospirae bacterium]|nr:ATP-binding protein [Nitrospirota bacterium]